MLSSRHIEVGRYYVNEEGNIAREILEISSQIVVYSTYDLKEGNIYGMPYKLCTQSDIFLWADREATFEEVNHLKREAIEALFTKEYRAGRGKHLSFRSGSASGGEKTGKDGAKA